MIQSPRWKMLRTEQLSKQPLCELCQLNGIVRSARCVHHITPVESAKSESEMELLCYSPTNLQSLCYECHANIHKEERSHSKEAVKKRAKDNLDRWINNHKTILQ